MTVAAPTVLPAKGPTQFITVGGTQLALPLGARLDLAYTFTESPASVSPPIAFSYTVAGGYYEVPFLAATTLTATADTYPLVVVFNVLDNTQRSVLTIPATIQQPADSFNYVYNFAVGLGGAYTTNDFPASGGGQSFSVIPLPPMLLPPGFTWSVLTPELDLYTGDFSDSYVQSLRIPSQSGAVAASRPSLQLT